jgi:hypothetical protein
MTCVRGVFFRMTPKTDVSWTKDADGDGRRMSARDILRFGCIYVVIFQIIVTFCIIHYNIYYLMNLQLVKRHKKSLETCFFNWTF